MPDMDGPEKCLVSEGSKQTSPHVGREVENPLHSVGIRHAETIARQCFHVNGADQGGDSLWTGEHSGTVDFVRTWGSRLQTRWGVDHFG